MRCDGWGNLHPRLGKIHEEHVRCLAYQRESLTRQGERVYRQDDPTIYQVSLSSNLRLCKCRNFMVVVVELCFSAQECVSIRRNNLWWSLGVDWPVGGFSMDHLLTEIRHNPWLWLLAFVPVVFGAAKLEPEAHTLLFVLSVLAIV